TVSAANVQPAPYGTPASLDIPNLIRRSFSPAPVGAPVSVRASGISSTAVSANGRSISTARWNSQYLIPRLNPSITTPDSAPAASFTAPDWVLLTGQGPNTAPAPNAVIGRYAFAVYDEGGLMPMSIGGFPTYAGLTLPTRPGRPALPTRRMPVKHDSEQSEVMLAAFTPNAPSNCKVPKFTPDHTNAPLSTEVPVSIFFNTNGDMPQTFSASSLPHGLSINTTNGN